MTNEQKAESTLSPKQKAYYDERVEFIRAMGIAVPYGLIHEWAIDKTDEACEKWLADINKSENGKSKRKATRK